ncbi:MAG: hypothetical protein GX663_07435 [Clostridiales bacterium]|nr:hypothetical protein [Clostridiales bacterium]
MYIRNNIVSAIFRIIFIIACGAGLALKLLDTGISLDAFLSDFALLASTLALAYFIYLLIARPRYERGFLRGAVTIYLLLIFIMNSFIAMTPLSTMGIANTLLYFVSPLVAFVDYLLFCPKGGFHPYNPLTWAILPAIYNLAIAILNHFIPTITGSVYFTFLNMGFILSLLVFLGIGYLLFLIDSLMAGRRH